MTSRIRHQKNGNSFGFCKECGNILLPKRKENVLYCKVCDKNFPLDDPETIGQYKKREKINSKRTRNKKRVLKTAIVEESAKKPSISADERDAYEEYFEPAEMD